MQFCGSVLQLLKGGVRLERRAQSLSSLIADLVVTKAVRKGSREASAMSWGANTFMSVIHARRAVGSVPDRKEALIGHQGTAQRLCALSSDVITVEAVRQGSHEASAMSWVASLERLSVQWWSGVTSEARDPP